MQSISFQPRLVFCGETEQSFRYYGISNCRLVLVSKLLGHMVRWKIGQFGNLVCWKKCSAAMRMRGRLQDDEVSYLYLDWVFFKIINIFHFTPTTPPTLLILNWSLRAVREYCIIIFCRGGLTHPVDPYMNAPAAITSLFLSCNPMLTLRNLVWYTLWSVLL